MSASSIHCGVRSCRRKEKGSLELESTFQDLWLINGIYHDHPYLTLIGPSSGASVVIIPCFVNTFVATCYSVRRSVNQVLTQIIESLILVAHLL